MVFNAPRRAPPESLARPRKEVALLRATGLRFINGVSSSYDTTFPPVLENVLSESAFIEAIGRLNNVLAMYWPCTACFLCGYVFSPVTLGLSLACPRICVGEAEKHGQQELEQLNHSHLFRSLGMVWGLRKSLLQSWIVIELPVKAEGPEGDREER
ncbi:Golgin subfamily A member 7/ERF4 [Nannochloropsis gaditana]|uniref:Golgin subfamily A member 7/ERF4 n=1 Tax=Nannochloropsis gaditana TaxID=72520 RepID=W7TD52_9STRA|nr:Golgin subfamily A member 7/ERF4 [Nannochloropsis gaditana]